MFIKNHKKLNKRGFTLAESVIALAVIAISSVGALSLVISAQRSTFSAAQKQQAQIFAADIIACYRADGDFNQNVEFALGLENDWDGIAPITLDGGLTAIVDTTTAPTIEVTIQNEKGTELTSQSFTKGETP